MLRVVKAKNQRSKRYLESREAKVVENTKTALFIRGGNTSQLIQDVLKELYHFKKPDASMFKKKNPIYPFEDRTSLEFFSNRNDSSLFLFASHSKKRPHNLVMGRMFEHQVLDMVELGCESFTGSSQFSTFENSRLMKTLGSKPCLIFQGELFEQKTEYVKLKSLFVDFFRGPVVEKVNLAGFDHVMSFTALEAGRILLRNYHIVLKRSGSRVPFVELLEMGPSIDFRIGRDWYASKEVQKLAYRVPKEIHAKKRKNVHHDSFGNTMGVVHKQRQDLDALQTRKLKALKRGVEGVVDGEGLE
eukprot:Sdes_comp20806_c0_seq1m17142